MNEQQVKRVYEIFGSSESGARRIHIAPDPNKRDEYKGSITLHYSSEFIAELTTIPGLEVFEVGRCGARHPDGYICARSDEDQHRVHADGAKTWPNEEYGVDKVKLQIERDIARNMAMPRPEPPAFLRRPPPEKPTPKPPVVATAKPALVRLDPKPEAPPPPPPPQRDPVVEQEPPKADPPRKEKP